MKSIFKISFVLFILAVVNVGYANTETEGKKEAKETEVELQQTGQQQNQEKIKQDVSSEAERLSIDALESDSIEEDSVNKYNFIFYFLYKFKYDHEDL